MIRFLPGTEVIDGISIGGGGAVAIESGGLNCLESEFFTSNSDSNKLENGKFGIDANMYLASANCIYIYPARIENAENKTEHYLIIGDKILKSDKDNEWSLGSYSENWNSLYARSLIANDVLAIKADKEIEIFTNAIPSVDSSGNTVDNSKKTLLDIDGNFKLMNSERGYFLTDSTGNQYAGIYNNASNLWIGCQGNDTSYHHRGNTFISAGTNSSGNGNSTIYISVPDSTNANGHINHKAFHEGMNLIPRTTNTYDIGSSDYKWKTLYLNNFTIGEGTIKNSADTDVKCALIQSPANRYIALGGSNTTYVFAGGDNKIGLGHANVRWKGLWTYNFTIDANGHINNSLIPTKTNSYSLGRSLNPDKPDEDERRWKNAFFSGTVANKGNNSNFTVENDKWKIGLHLGSKGNNRGIYDFTNSRWIFNLDDSSILRINQNLIPPQDGTDINLGSTNTRWNNGYFKGNLYVTGLMKSGTFYAGGSNCGIQVTKINEDYGDGYAIYPYFTSTSYLAWVGAPSNAFDAVYTITVNATNVNATTINATTGIFSDKVYTKTGTVSKSDIRLKNV
jgi:hypothetical protein